MSIFQWRWRQRWRVSLWDRYLIIIFLCRKRFKSIHHCCFFFILQLNIRFSLIFFYYSCFFLFFYLATSGRLMHTTVLLKNNFFSLFLFLKVEWYEMLKSFHLWDILVWISISTCVPKISLMCLWESHEIKKRIITSSSSSISSYILI